jgi:hypothetical protein
MKQIHETFDEQFDFYWIGKVFNRFERDYLAGLEDRFLVKRYALTPALLGKLKKLVEIRTEKVKQI